jgi:hypothetical protein
MFSTASSLSSYCGRRSGIAQRGELRLAPDAGAVFLASVCAQRQDEIAPSGLGDNSEHSTATLQDFAER